MTEDFELPDSKYDYSTIQSLGPKEFKLSYFRYPEFATILVKGNECILFPGVAYRKVQFKLDDIETYKERIVRHMGQENYDRLEGLKN